MTTNQPHPPAVLIVGHGSPREIANQGFIALVGRIARRLEGSLVMPAFFSIARPSIEDQVAVLVAKGVQKITLMPYFLYTGQHVSKDIPALLDNCRKANPGLELDVLATLEGEAALEDIVVDRLTPLFGCDKTLPTDGAAIEKRSHEIIEVQLAGRGPIEARERAIMRRVVHATADLSFAQSLRFHPQAVDRGLAALAAGKPILCDVRMLEAGVTKLPGKVLCNIDEPEVVQAARDNVCTRAAASMEKFRPLLDGAIVAIGNAPTALWKILEIAASGGPHPALVVGLPVGFVGARESKLALLASDLCYITNTSSRGGSPVAAAAINALALLAKGTSK